MKTLLVCALAILASQISFAQLKKQVDCPTFVVDVLDGHINKYNTKSTMAEIQKAFPCFTDVAAQASGNTCASISYKDKGVYFFPERNYVEIRENFKGKLSVPLMGAQRKNLFRTLGNPVLKDAGWDAFKTNYGILILYYNKAGKVNKLQMSNKTVDSIKLCEGS